MSRATELPPLVEKLTRPLVEGVSLYQAVAPGRQPAGSSPATLSSTSSRVSVNGRESITVALSKSSFGAGAAAAVYGMASAATTAASAPRNALLRSSNLERKDC